jgi:hypothetical protein
MAKEQPKILGGEYTRALRSPWMFDGKTVTCGSCGEEISGRLLLRTVERRLFGTFVEPCCIECLIEEAVSNHGFFDLGSGPTDGVNDGKDTSLDPA